MEVEVEKEIFLSCVQEKLCTFKIFTGEEQGQVAFCFDVSHMNSPQIALRQLRTLYILFDAARGRDCFFFSHCCCENFDELLQAQISGCGIALRNLQQGFQIERRELNMQLPEELAEMRDVEGFNAYRGELFLSSNDKIAALCLLEYSLVSEVELIGRMQFKSAVIFLNRLLFREILQNEAILSEYLVKVVWKVGQQWQEISSAYLLQTLKDIISVINVEYQQLSHLVALQPAQGKQHDQLKLFWPLQDLTDHSSPYDILHGKQSFVELKPGQHIFYRQGAISLLRSSQIHGIYLDNFQKDTKQILNICEYGMPDLDSLFRRSGSYSKSSSDHPFKVLLRAQLILSLKNPIRFSLKDTEVDAFAKIIKTGQLSNMIADDFAFFVEQVVTAFCDTFFVSLGE